MNRNVILVSDICIISTNRLEIEAAARNRIVSFIGEMKLRDFRVHLISMDRESFILDTSPNFTHHKFSIIDNKTSNFFKRTFLEIRISLMAIKQANQQNCRCYLVTIPSMFLLFVNFLLRKDCIKILDIRDLSWEYLSDSNVIHKFAKILFRRIAFNRIKLFDLISVTNHHEVNYLKDKLRNHQILLHISNGISEKEFNLLSKVGKKNTSNKVSITYVGNVGLGQDLSTFVKASKNMPSVIFNIAGDGTDLKRIKELADDKQSNLNFLGRINFEEILDIYKGSDILYAQLTESYSGAMPSKLYEYLSTGKCIIFGGTGVAPLILKDFENVHVIQPNDRNALESTINKIIDNHEHASTSAYNISLVGQKFIRERIAKNLVSEISELSK